MAVYVDDLAIAGNIDDIIDFKESIGKLFKIRDLGRLNYILGIRVEYRADESMLINQKQYIIQMVERFGMECSKPSDIPIQPNHKLTLKLEDEPPKLQEPVDLTRYRQLIGSLIYLTTCTRPDISYSVGLLARFMQQPKVLHWKFLLRLLRY